MCSQKESLEAVKLYIVNLWCNNQEISDGVGSPSEESPASLELGVISGPEALPIAL